MSGRPREGIVTVVARRAAEGGAEGAAEGGRVAETPARGELTYRDQAQSRIREVTATCLQALRADPGRYGGALVLEEPV